LFYISGEIKGKGKSRVDWGPKSIRSENPRLTLAKFNQTVSPKVGKRPYIVFPGQRNLLSKLIKNCNEFCSAEWWQQIRLDLNTLTAINLFGILQFDLKLSRTPA